MSLLGWMAILLGCAAICDDLRRRHIANWINVAGLAGGLAWHAVDGGVKGLALSAAGAAVGFALFAGFYLLGGMGAGDVKLAAAFGALLGPSGMLLAALLAAPLGALLAAACLAWRWRTRAIPYAPALTVGAWLAMVGRG